ncbi:MAG: aldehyde dehydrogenase family protein [Paracoccaceae bacterium]
MPSASRATASLKPSPPRWRASPPATRARHRAARLAGERRRRHAGRRSRSGCRRQGARLIGGGGTGTIPNAAALDGVTPQMRLYAEESFGPVVAIIRAATVDEAVRIANESEFGLAAAVFGRDTMRALAVAKRIESGICHINGPTVHDEAQMPFGGVKASGYGRFGGTWGSPSLPTCAGSRCRTGRCTTRSDLGGRGPGPPRPERGAALCAARTGPRPQPCVRTGNPVPSAPRPRRRAAPPPRRPRPRS